MSYVERHRVSVTTDSGGDATEYTPNVRGRIVAIVYTKTDFASGVDFDISLETTGQELWDEDNVNASKTVWPKQLNDDTVGADLAGEYQHIYAANERVKIVIAEGGNAKSGTFDILVA